MPQVVSGLVGCWQRLAEAVSELPPAGVEDASGGEGSAGSALEAGWASADNGTSSSSAGGGLPPAMRSWRLQVGVVRCVDEAMRACAAVRPSEPPGSEAALAACYGPLLRLLAGQMARYVAARLGPLIASGLPALAKQLVGAADTARTYGAGAGGAGSLPVPEPGGGQSRNAPARAGPQGQQRQQQQQAVPGDAGPGAGVDAEPDLVPFTFFEPGLEGEGEALGGLEDDDDADGSRAGHSLSLGGSGGPAEEGEEDGEEVLAGSSGRGGGWDSAAEGEGEGGVDGLAEDLALGLDLDDGFNDDDGDLGLGGKHKHGAPATGGASAGTPAGAAAAGVRGGGHGASDVARLAALVEGVLLGGLGGIGASSAPGVEAAAGRWLQSGEARARRGVRLQHLAAYEWLHEHHLLQVISVCRTARPMSACVPSPSACVQCLSCSACNPLLRPLNAFRCAAPPPPVTPQALPPGSSPAAMAVGAGMRQFFQQERPDALQPSARVTAASRLQLLTALQV